MRYLSGDRRFLRFLAPLALFDVLGLFLDPINRRLDFNNSSADFHIQAFAGDGVGLAEHFLAQEVERAANRLAMLSINDLTKLDQVAFKPRNFLRDVDTIGKNGHFAEEVFFLDALADLGKERFHALSEAILVEHDDFGGPIPDHAEVTPDALAVGVEVIVEGLAFAFAHGDELLAGLLDEAGEAVAAACDHVFR